MPGAGDIKWRYGEGYNEIFVLLYLTSGHLYFNLIYQVNDSKFLSKKQER